METSGGKWFDLWRGVVMPSLCDAYGHMNVRHYAAFFDEAGWHVLSLAGLSLADIRSRGLGTVVATLTRASPTSCASMSSTA